MLGLVLLVRKIMRFASSITCETDHEKATAELLSPIDSMLTPGMADVGFLFVTAHFEDELDGILAKVQDFLPHATIIGCTAEGVVGADKEIERKPAMSLLAGSMPNVDIRLFHIEQEHLKAVKSVADMERLVGVSPESLPSFVAFADPFTINVMGLLDVVNKFYPGAPLLGGIASAASSPGDNQLILSEKTVRSGVVGVALSGELTVETVVSQGCRPIGKPFVVTRGERNVVAELGGRPALERLHDVLTTLPTEDEELARQAIFVGRVIDERKERFARGDFLIQNIVGVDRESGALGIAGHARVGATVQFHVRDADSADEDLHAMLAPYAGLNPKGALLFSCNGRGTNMWSELNHDINSLHTELGEVPAAGFFCGGEFGPIAGSNFVHGFTASIGLICDGRKG